MKIDRAFLGELGLGDLTEEQSTVLISLLVRTLEKRVGTQLAERLSETQLAEFSRLLDRGENEAALEFLRDSIPDFQAVVQEHLDLLKEELTVTSTQIRDLLRERVLSPANVPSGRDGGDSARR